MNWKLALIGMLSVAVAPAAVRSGTTRDANPSSDRPPKGGALAGVAAGDAQPAPQPKEVLRFYPETPPVPANISRTEYMWVYVGQVTAVDKFSITIRARGEQPKR